MKAVDRLAVLEFNKLSETLAKEGLLSEDSQKLRPESFVHIPHIIKNISFGIGLKISEQIIRNKPVWSGWSGTPQIAYLIVKEILEIFKDKPNLFAV